MKTKLPEKITTIEEAKKFLLDLHLNNEVFHPEDDANDLVNDPFTKEEGDKLNELMDQIHSTLNFDPCEYLLDLPYDIVIIHDDVFAVDFDINTWGGFKWSSNLSEAKRFEDKDVERFLDKAKKNKWPYKMVKIPKK